MRAPQGRLTPACTRSGIIYGPDQQNSSRIATILSRICPPDTFTLAMSANTFFFPLSANCFGEFGGEKNLPHSHQSFSF
jgi:hypothetical protein